ncbi:unnamed protein product [Triticum aestivum]|uniref:AAA+ ATPase domain-containing protein n=1 Tax=Triticum aestivum TaxID=4565 RepID=A0A7H4LAK3_WHEAT|nr:unnamed protein product [Triticum aestivum]
MEATVLSIGKSVLNGALSYAKSTVAGEVALQLGVQGDQAFITDELEMMQAFLEAAHEERDDHKVVKTWVKQVRDMAYDVEDSLQDFAVRIENYSWWRIRTLLDRRRVAKEMKDLRIKVEDVSQRNVRYRLIRRSGCKPTSNDEQSTISTEVQLQIAEATRAALQDKKKVDLVKLITRDDDVPSAIAVWGSSSDVGVASIIRAAYNNQDVKSKFECRAWMRLTHPFNPNDFFASLVRQFYGELCKDNVKRTGLQVLKHMESQDNLVDEFNRFVTDNRYLVVINDVSTIEEWDWIKTYFPNNKGSQIIVSTQQFEVASLCTEQPYMLSEIEQNWSIDKEFFAFYKKVDTRTEEDDKAGSSSTEPEKLTPASAMAAALVEGELIDRVAAKAKVMELLTPVGNQGGEVIAIYGMGGLGKTTLVRSVYQQEHGDRFQRRAWLTVSRSFTEQEFIGDLLQQFLRNNADKGEFGCGSGSGSSKEPIVQLAEILLEHKCLVVLDDLWSVGKWRWIMKLLPPPRNDGRNRIIVTTRELNIAESCSSRKENIYNLELLNETDARKLFQKKVFKDTMERDNCSYSPDMIEQENLILKKCGGLPLAISTVGSFLSSKPKTAIEWRNLNKHISAELEVNPELGMIKTVLTSSYEGLPYVLKPCFLYLSIFSEDQDIRWKRLVRRWIAEGYSRGIRGMTAEEIGTGYITQLIKRTMVQPSKGATRRTRRIVFLQVHDLIREIGISKAVEENLVTTLEGSCNINTEGKIRHLAVSSSWRRDQDAFECALDLSRLRSLTVFLIR